jgi:hypothetical protein
MWIPSNTLESAHCYEAWWQQQQHNLQRHQQLTAPPVYKIMLLPCYHESAALASLATTWWVHRLVLH